MIYSYYPGCTLKSKATELDIYGRKSAAALGIELVELPDWQCCGATYPQVNDEIARRLGAVRALRDAENDKLITMCSACHHVLKRTAYDWNQDANFRTKATNFMKAGVLKPEEAYDGKTEVTHLLELIRDEIGFAELKKQVKKPLKGRKIGAFYGCMFLRPGKVLAFDDPENPTILEDFIRALGAEPVAYPYRNECCGAYVALEDKSAATAQVNKAIHSAKAAGAEELITACPLCMYNLVHNAAGETMPVHYFTEILAEALGLKEED